MSIIDILIKIKYGEMEPEEANEIIRREFMALELAAVEDFIDFAKTQKLEVQKNRSSGKTWNYTIDLMPKLFEQYKESRK